MRMNTFQCVTNALGLIDHAFHDLYQLAHLGRRLVDLLIDGPELITNVTRGIGGLAGQLTHLIRDDGEPSTILTCTCGLDRGIQGQ